MRKYIPLLALSLLACLFIYVFYRTEKTLVNYMLIKLFSAEGYYSMKGLVTTLLSLPDFIVYSLPEGLWVLCITVTSSYFYIDIHNFKLRLIFVQILLAILMEVFQLTGILNGRFDIIDIIFAAGFWVIGLLLTRTNLSKESLFRCIDSNVICCFASYTIVYLAHVIY